MEEKFKINKQFLQFKGKNVIVVLIDQSKYKGKLISIDNYFNIILEQNKNLLTLKGGKVIEIILD